MRLPSVLTTALLLSACATRAPVPDPGHLGTSASRDAGAPPPLVDRGLPLPKPTPVRKTDTYSVVVSNVPIRDLLFALARDARINVDIDPTVQGRVTLNALNQPLTAIMARVARQVPIRYQIEGDVLTVQPDLPFLKTYSIDYVNNARVFSSRLTTATSIASAGSGGSAKAQVGAPGWADKLTSEASKIDADVTANASDSTVVNVADNRFWERLERNVIDLLASSRRVSAQRKAEREAQEAKDEERQNAELSQKHAEARQREREERMKTAQIVAQAGSGAANLFQQVINEPKTGDAKAATPHDADAARDVFAHPETGTLTVNATQAEHEAIAALIAQLTTSARRQVMIEATIVEVQLNNQYQSGINWSVLKNQDNRLNLTQGNLGNSLADTAAMVLNYTKTASGLLNGADFSATIRLLEQFGKTRVLSSPKVMALNNQPAVLKVVDEKVYFTLQYTPGTPATATTPATAPTYSSQVNTVPVGVVMNVIPQIGDNQQISLTVRPTISRIVGYKADPAVRLATNQQVENLVPEIQVRELESTLQLSSGQVAVLGGLIQDNVQTQRDGVPGLSRLPWGIGDLFSYRNDQAGKTELVIFIRPVIVNQPSLDGDLANSRPYLPGADFFTQPEDELSVFRAGLPAPGRKSP